METTLLPPDIDVPFISEVSRLLETARLAKKRGPIDEDTLKDHCARSAYKIMAVHSTAPIVGTKGGRFRCIASAFFEFATGKADVDLVQACGRILKNRPYQDSMHSAFA
jgi:hypothetical protein